MLLIFYQKVYFTKIHSLFCSMSFYFVRLAQMIVVIRIAISRAIITYYWPKLAPKQSKFYYIFICSLNHISLLVIDTHIKSCSLRVLPYQNYHFLLCLAHIYFSLFLRTNRNILQSNLKTEQEGVGSDVISNVFINLRPPQLRAVSDFCYT